MSSASPRARAEVPHLAPRPPLTVIDLIGTAIVVQPRELPAVRRDPADDTYLAAATAVAADFIVTADADLLDLGVFEAPPSSRRRLFGNEFG